MSSVAIFLLQALVIVVLSAALLRFSGLKSVMPLVVMQIVVGIALGPSVFGRIAPIYFKCLLAQRPCRLFLDLPRSRW
jgi:uncharacterized membrane protein YcaP (DUF421 family)